MGQGERVRRTGRIERPGGTEVRIEDVSESEDRGSFREPWNNLESLF